MAERDIHYDDVVNAAQALVQQGQPVSLASVHQALGARGATQTIHQHLSSWRAAQTPPAAPLNTELPQGLQSALTSWAQQLSQEAAERVRADLTQAQSDLSEMHQINQQAQSEHDALQAKLAEREASIERLTIELRHARDIASDALVSKAKDQLAIGGKDAQLTELRRQLEHQVAASAAESDARLAAEMELVGVTTARDNFAAEIKELREQLDASRAAKRAA